MSFGPTLKALRISKGLSQSEVAEKIEVSYDTVLRIEKNDLRVAIGTVLAYCKALNTSLGEVLSDEGFSLKGLPASKDVFCQKLSALMNTKGLNRVQLSELTGIPYQTVSSYVVGKRYPSKESAEALSVALGVSLIDIGFHQAPTQEQRLALLESELKVLKNKLK
jgi:transcriptional regulator with XRE-family HTH domain